MEYNKKILLISGSPRKNGNTELLTNYCSKELSKINLDPKIINLSNKQINAY